MDSHGVVDFNSIFLVAFQLWKFQGVMGSGLSLNPKKVTQNLELLAQAYLKKSSIACMPFCESD